MANGGEIDVALRDGMNMIVADTKTRSRLIDAWTATLEGIDAGMEVRAVVDGRLVEITPALASDGAFGDPRRSVVSRAEIASLGPADSTASSIDVAFERTQLITRSENLIVQVGEAAKALDSARTKHEQALEGLARREEKAREALAVLEDAGGGVHAPEIEEMRLALEAEERKLEAAKLLHDRLASELEFDRTNRHVRQAALTRVALHEVEEVVSRRRGLMTDLGSQGLVDSSLLAGMERAFGAVTPENSIDPLAMQLAQRWQEMTSRKASRSDQALIQAIRSAEQRLGMARAEFERLRMETQQPTSPSGGAFSVIEQALHLVLDERSGGDSNAQRLKREMLDGPGPLMEVEGWSQQRGPTRGQLLESARVDLERIQTEYDQLVQQQRVSNTVDLEQVETMLRGDITQYLGSDPGAHVGRELAKVRVIPAIQRAVMNQVVAFIERTSAEVERLRVAYEAVDRRRVANTARKAGARSIAMRAVADVEAHRRETQRVAEMVTAASATLVARETEHEQTEKALAEMPEQNDEVADADPIEPYRAFLLARVVTDQGDVPVFFDNTFSGLDAPLRWELLTVLADLAQTGRQIIYVGEDGDNLDWAETTSAVAVGRV